MVAASPSRPSTRNCEQTGSPIRPRDHEREALAPRPHGLAQPRVERHVSHGAGDADGAELTSLAKRVSMRGERREAVGAVMPTSEPGSLSNGYAAGKRRMGVVTRLHAGSPPSHP